MNCKLQTVVNQVEFITQQAISNDDIYKINNTKIDLDRYFTSIYKSDIGDEELIFNTIDNGKYLKRTFDINVSKDTAEIVNNFITDDIRNGVISGSSDYKKHILSLSKNIEGLWNDVDKNYSILYQEYNKDTTRTFGQYITDKYINSKDKIVLNIGKKSRIMSRTEAFLHEILHSVFKNVYTKDKKKFYEIGKIRHQLLLDGINYMTFLKNIKNPTKQEIEIAKSKFNRIFSEDASLEEFAAYVYTNPILYEMVKNKNIKAIRSDNKGILPTISNVFELAKHKVYSKKLGKEILDDTFMKIIKYRKQEELMRNAVNVKEYLKSIEFLNRYNLIGKPIITAGAFIDLLNKILIKPLNKQIIKMINMLFKTFDNIMNSQHISNTYQFLLKLPFIKQILLNNILIDLKRQLFSDTASGKYKEFYTKFNDINSAVEYVTTSLKQSVINNLKDKTILKPENFEHQQKFIEYFLKKGYVYAYDRLRKNNFSVSNAIKDIRINGTHKQLEINMVKELYKIYETDNSFFNTFREDIDSMATMIVNTIPLKEWAVQQTKNNINILYMIDDSYVNYTFKFVEVDKIKSSDYVVLGDKLEVEIENKKFKLVKEQKTDFAFQSGMLKYSSYLPNTVKFSDLIYEHLAPASTIEEFLKIDQQEPKARKLERKKFLAGWARSFRDFMMDIPSKDLFIDFDIDKNRKDAFLNLSSSDIITEANPNMSLDVLLPYIISKRYSTKYSELKTKEAVKFLETFYFNNRDNKDIDFVKLGDLQSFTDKKIDMINTLKNIYIPRELEFVVLGTHLKESEYKIIRIAEKIMADTFSKLKSFVILYNSGIFASNLISNMTIAKEYGVSPTYFIKQFIKDWTTLSRVNKIFDKFLFHKHISRNVEQFKILKEQLLNSRYFELIDDGQFTPFNDSIDLNQMKQETYLGEKIKLYIKYDDREKSQKAINNETYNRFVKITKGKQTVYENIELFNKIRTDVIREHNKKAKISNKINDVYDFLYGSDDSKMFEIATKAIQFGDIITKQIILDKLIADYVKVHKKSPSKQVMKEFLREMKIVFIDYSLPTNKFQTYFEKVLGLLFMKYLLRFAKGYVKVARRNPIGVMNTQIFQNVLDINFADPLDTAMRDISTNLAAREQLLHPFDALETLIEPNIIRPFDLNFNEIVKIY